MKSIQAIKATEVTIGIMPKRHMKLDDFSGCDIEIRALEVALVGSHPIAILFHNGSLASQLIQTAQRIAQENQLPFHGLAFPWCPCGNYGSPRHECRCNPKAIERHLGTLGKRLDEFDLWISASIPSAHHLSCKGEPEVTVLKRIEAARSAPQPETHLGSDSLEFISAYISNVSDRLDVGRMKTIAATIARLEGSKSVGVQHVAEAILYQPHSLRGFCEWIKPHPVEVAVEVKHSCTA